MPVARSNASIAWLDEHLPLASTAKPPWNHPQVTPAAVNRSPMLRPVSAAVEPCEHTSQYGSVSLVNVPIVPLVAADVWVDETGAPHSGTLP